MNASGEAVAALSRFYRIAAERLLVVVDDADLPLGTLRLRPSGSSGGHHGLESIEQHLTGQSFARLRVGIGRDQPTTRQISGHVLAAFAAAEQPLLEKVLERATDQVECWVEAGPAVAMNRFNGTIDQ
jgi:PTH1 family peptidyl-tRNA hydrolase